MHDTNTTDGRNHARSGPTTTRRGALAAGAGLLGVGLAGVARARPADPWTDRSATYDLTSTRVTPDGEQSVRDQRITTDVVGRRGNVLVMDSRTVEDGRARTARYQVPVEAVFAAEPGKRETGPGGSVVETGTVADGWVTDFDGVISEDEHGDMGMAFELVDAGGDGAARGKQLMLLPQLVPPDRHVAPARKPDTDASTQGVTTRGSVWRYAYSRLTTKDNGVANLVTAKSDLQAWNKTDSTDSYMVDAGWNWSHQTLANWWKRYTSTNKTINYSNVVVDGEAAYQGYFPLSTATSYWRDFHYHTHKITRSGHYTTLKGKLKTGPTNWGPWAFWKSKTFYDGSRKYSVGSRQSGSWYIV